MMGLTLIQRSALNYIKNYRVEHGVSPSYDQIRDKLGWKSKSAVHRVLMCLEQRGAIVRSFNRARSIVPAPSANAVVLELPPDLDLFVRDLAKQAETTPEAVIIECVRDRLSGGTFKAPTVSQKHRSIA